MKKVQLINGETGLLTSLTDTARQAWIDQIVQYVNEGNDELYSSAEMEMPRQLLEGTLTLATNDRDYTLASIFSSVDVDNVRWPFQDQTNGQYISLWRAGYRNLINTQLTPANFTGLPEWGCIRETDGEIYLDRIPTANENGRTYTVWGDKDLEMSLAADEVPYDDDVFRAMVPVWAKLWERDNRNKFDDGAFRLAVGRASRRLNKIPERTDYNPRGPVFENLTDPFNA